MQERLFKNGKLLEEPTDHLIKIEARFDPPQP